VSVILRRSAARICTYAATQKHSAGGRRSNLLSLYVAEGIAQGFQTLTANARVLYNMSEFYHPESGGGIRWNDPALAITWSISNPVISAKNAATQRSMQRFDGEGGA
jgi:dTDP-4-dehydrorhamnose 3,5-epimerase-like enzyme